MRSFDSHAKEYQVLKNTVPALDFDGSIPLSEWKKTAKEKLNELLGLPLEYCDPLFEIEYKEEHTKEYIEKIIENLAKMCDASIIITGINSKEDKISTAVYDNGTLTYIENKKQRAVYSGTGDVFASV